MISTVGETLLQRLTDGGPESVLVADFQAWATAPRLSELLARRATSSRVYRIDPVGVLTGEPAYRPLSALADTCVRRYRAAEGSGRRVHVVGHCSASALALHVADQLGDDREVSVVLVAPTWPDEHLVRAKFAEFLGNIGARSHPCPSLAGDPAVAVGRLAEVLRSELGTIARSRGVDPAAGVFAELLGWYRGWLAFLLACRHHPVTPWRQAPARVTVLTGPDSTPHVPGLVSGTYPVVRVPVLAENSPITPDLADALLPRLSRTAGSRRAADPPTGEADRASLSHRDPPFPTD